MSTVVTKNKANPCMNHSIVSFFIIPKINYSIHFIHPLIIFIVYFFIKKTNFATTVLYLGENIAMEN